MADDFEDHCWKDIVPPDVLDIYTPLRPQDLRRAGAGAARDRSLRAGLPGRRRSRSPSSHKTYPSSCGENAYAAIEPTKRLFAAARAAGMPMFYTTQDTAADSLPTRVTATKRARAAGDPALYAIKSEFKPQPGDVVITKQRASGLLRHAADGASDPARHPDRDRLRREHVGLRARLGGRCLFQRLPRRRWSRSAASTAACCRTRSICSTCITSTPT